MNTEENIIWDHFKSLSNFLLIDEGSRINPYKFDEFFSVAKEARNNFHSISTQLLDLITKSSEPIDYGVGLEMFNNLGILKNNSKISLFQFIKESLFHGKLQQHIDVKTAFGWIDMFHSIQGIDKIFLSYEPDKNIQLIYEGKAIFDVLLSKEKIKPDLEVFSNYYRKYKLPIISTYPVSKFGLHQDINKLYPLSEKSIYIHEIDQFLPLLLFNIDLYLNSSIRSLEDFQSTPLKGSDFGISLLIGIIITLIAIAVLISYAFVDSKDWKIFLAFAGSILLGIGAGFLFGDPGWGLFAGGITLSVMASAFSKLP